MDNMIDSGVQFRFMTARPGNITYVPLGWMTALQNTGTKIVMGVQKGFVAASAMGNSSFSAFADPIRAYTVQYPKKARIYKSLQSRKQVLSSSNVYVTMAAMFIGLTAIVLLYMFEHHI